MNVQNLFKGIRLVAKTLTQQQVDSVNAILDACGKYGVFDKRYVAYIIATCWHESKLKPVEEVGKGKGYPYGKMLDMGGGPGKRVPYTSPNKLYYGRGLVQITWRVNYKAFSNLLGVDLLNSPELALSTPVAAEIAVLGMLKGYFTGVKLSDAFNANETDPIEARGIVNGTDKAKLIAGYFWTIYNEVK